jgi:SAM-dependent methyltransferase
MDLSDEELLLAYWSKYPRFRFIKSLPQGARLLDVGAGSGGLGWWKSWGTPDRSDLVFYGIDQQRGEFSNLYAGWEIVDLNQEFPTFGGLKFDAFYASHLIEHLKSLENLFEDFRRASAPGCSLYLEWPAPKTTHFPTTKALTQAANFEIQTFNFFDDNTHLIAYEIDVVRDTLAQHGFKTREAGEVWIDAEARELIARGRRRNDLSWRQMGLWAATGWCNYLIAEDAL